MVLRTHLLASVFFALILRPCLANDLQWQFDLISATETASVDDKLLIVVQFDNDFLQSPKHSKELETYTQHVFSSATDNWLQDHAVLVSENVGRPSNLVWEAGRKKPSVSSASSPHFGNTITWLCRPDGTVLAFLIGYPDNSAILKSKIEDCQQAIQHAGDPANFQQLQNWHLSQVESEDQQLFLQFFKKQLRRSKTPQAPPVDAAVSSFIETRQQRIEHRFGANWNKRQIQNLTNALAGHASVEHHLIHLMLAQLPETHFQSLQSAMWREAFNAEICTPNKSVLQKWLVAAEASSKQILLRIAGPNGKFPAWPSSDSAQELLEETTRLDVSLCDLALLANELGAGVIKIPKNSNPTFFLSTGAGKPCKLLTHVDSDSELTKQLSQISANHKEGN